MNTIEYKLIAFGNKYLIRDIRVIPRLTTLKKYKKSGRVATKNYASATF